MPIEQLDVVPSRYRPTTFTADMENFLAWMARNVPNYNALEQSLQLVATTGTSTTSLAIGTGSKTLTTQAGKAWAVGSFVYVVSAASVTNLMIGQVTAYNSVTGSLTVSVVTSSGAGTLASWVVGLSAPLGSSASFSGAVTAAVLAVDGNFYSALVSGNPVIYFDTNDYIWYDRTNNKMGFSVGGTDRFTVDATDGPQRTTDASTNNGLVRKAQMDAAVSGGPVVGAFRALTASATGTSATVSVATDEIVVASAANAYATLRAVSLSINSAGSGANGLDTGTLAANTWYSVWVIYNGTTVAGLVSLSATSPTMPSSYTHKARVGWIRTDSSGNRYPLPFRQYGRRVYYAPTSSANLTALPIMASGVQGNPVTPTWVSVSVSAFVPPTAGAVDLMVQASSNSAVAAPNNGYGGYTSLTNKPPLVISDSSASNYSVSRVMGLESGNVYFASDNTGGALVCAGWEDNL